MQPCLNAKAFQNDIMQRTDILLKPTSAGFAAEPSSHAIAQPPSKPSAAVPTQSAAEKFATPTAATKPAANDVRRCGFDRCMRAHCREWLRP